MRLAAPGRSRPSRNTFEYCENGAKATVWEQTAKRVGPDFFAAHTVTELLTWPDYDLEEKGRLTAPAALRSGERPIRAGVVGGRLRRDRARAAAPLDPNAAVFYASGRASLETSYMYALFARMYGTNNLPDCSNMCHEPTSVGLNAIDRRRRSAPRSSRISRPPTCILFFGQNVGSNAPRMLHPLQEARKRRVPDHHLQSAARARARALHQPADRPLEMLTRHLDRDLDPVSSGQGRRRHRGDHRHVQGR